MEELTSERGTSWIDVRITGSAGGFLLPNDVGLIPELQRAASGAVVIERHLILVAVHKVVDGVEAAALVGIRVDVVDKAGVLGAAPSGEANALPADCKGTILV